MEANQWIQIPGAVLILAAYVLLQGGWWSAGSRRFAVTNMVGAGLLAFEAGRTQQWGFLLLEGTWAVVSFVSFLRAPNDRD